VTISRVSRARSGCATRDDPSASAAKMSARLVSDFEPGSATLAASGAVAAGAGQG
jgi:hypothetical protein